MRLLLLALTAAVLTGCGGTRDEGATGCAVAEASAGPQAGDVARPVPTRDPRELASLSPDQAFLVAQLAAVEAGRTGEVSGVSAPRALTAAPAPSCAKTETGGH